VRFWDLAPTIESALDTPRRGPAESPRTLPATALALQRAAGNRATQRVLARFLKGATKTTVKQVSALPLAQQIDFLIAVGKSQMPDPEVDNEVRDLHRGLVLDGLDRAGNRVKSYKKDTAFAGAVAVLEALTGLGGHVAFEVRLHQGRDRPVGRPRGRGRRER